jgi:cytoskeletal protein CcmA (bactofilin family)
VAGQVSGAIMARERVELQATAVVAGDIHTPRIAVVEGAKVSGR